MTSVSAGHIILTPTQPVGSGRPQRESNPGAPHQESGALPTKPLRPLEEKEEEEEEEEEKEEEEEGEEEEKEEEFGNMTITMQLEGCFPLDIAIRVISTFCKDPCNF